MARAPAEKLEEYRRYPGQLVLPLEPMHGWRSAPDEGDHTHCEFCRHTIYRGDPVVGCYLRSISITFCPTCVKDNPELFREWLATKPT